MSEILKNSPSPQAVYSPPMKLLADGSDVVSGVSAEVSKDGGVAAAASGALLHVGHGVWSYIPTQAEINADAANVTFFKTDCGTVSVSLLTTGKRTGSLNDLSSGQATTAATAATPTVILGTSQPNYEPVKLSDLVDAITQIDEIHAERVRDADMDQDTGVISLDGFTQTVTTTTRRRS
jgi:hypothetical protein